MARIAGRMLALFLLLAAGWIGGAQAKTLLAGAGKPYPLPSAAIKAAAPGDTVEIYPGQYFDCATVDKDRLTITGVGDGVVLTDETCAGKAILITTADDITIRNITLQRARVADQNGAGIRAEGTNLTLDHVTFINNEDGILAADNPNSTIRILASTFDRNGKCEQYCAHGIYVNSLKLLDIENSHFIGTKQGHHIKSRAAATQIVNTTIEDGPDGTASYLVDIPNGGSLVMTNDTLEKGPLCENHGTAVTIGEEGVTQPTAEIVLKNITFRNDYGGGTTFLRNLTATPAEIIAPKFSGHPIKALDGDGRVS